MRKSIRQLLRLGLSAVLMVLVFVLAEIHPEEIWTGLSQLHVLPVAAIVAPILVGDRVLMAYKWNLLLRAAGVHISVWAALRVYWASNFIGLALPSTVGQDLFRTFALGSQDHDVNEALVSMVVERVLGFFAVAGMALAFLPFLAWRHAELRSAIVLVGLTIVAVLGGVAVILNRAVATWIGAHLPRLFGERPTRIVGRLYRAFAAYRDRRGILTIFFLLTLIESTLPILVTVVWARALHIDVSVLVLAAIVPLVLFIIRVPLGVGGIGLIEWSYVYLYGLVGMHEADALSLGLLVDVGGLLTALPGGLFLLGAWGRTPASAEVGAHHKPDSRL